MSSIKACIVTGNRAEFGQLAPLIRRMIDDQDFDVDLVVTASHLSDRAGKTVDEIIAQGFEISAEIPLEHLNDADDSRKNIALQICETIELFTDHFLNNRPDILIVIGDRYEMFGVSIAASNLLIPIAHICGGSTTKGSIDEVYRHSITKMSSLHFTTCDEYRNRVIQMGENPKSVYNVGSLAIENCLKVPLLSETEIREILGIDSNNAYCVVTYHPATLEENMARRDVSALIDAMSNFSFDYVVTLPNSDSGGKEIAKLWEDEAEKNGRLHIVRSLGTRRYLSSLKHSVMMIGNSSSGTTEGPAMHIPTVNVGTRQEGRYFAESVIQCSADTSSIKDAISCACSDEFQAIAKSVVNPFGDGSTSSSIVSILKKRCLSGLSVKKEFFDVDLRGKPHDA